MSRFARIRRRPDHWASAHERARARAAERLDGPLGLSESTWLDDHLSTCAACAAIAAAYEDDRRALRAGRAAFPPPPRDLWARTAAAIEQEAATSPRRARGPRRIPVGVLSGLAVIVVVVVVSAVSGDLLGRLDGTTAVADPGTAAPTAPAAAGPSPTPTAGIVAAIPTPFDVGAGDVRWFGRGEDGSLAYNAASVRKVCPTDTAESCATIDEIDGERLALTATPRSIIGSPTQQQAIMVTDDPAGGQQVTLVALPSRAPDPTAAPTVAPSDPPTPSESTPAIATPSVAPGSATPTATPPPATDEPTASPPPTPSPEVDTSATQEPSLSPEPTIAASLALARDITVVGESAAFSRDGEWFAFTARPIDGATGPDVYVWHVGDDAARRLTDDGSSTFASWDGELIVASRPIADTADQDGRPASVRIDPSSGDVLPAGDLWRPVVDPTAQRVVGWAGSVDVAEDGTAIGPSEGRLELLPWSVDGATTGTGATQVVHEGAVTDFDVRWDETGTWFATWLADPSGTQVGRLSLFRVDPDTGLLQQPDGAPQDVAALPGFSIGEGRLAWATPPGQGGEGSRVQVVAWVTDAVGSVETAPGEGLIVVR